MNNEVLNHPKQPHLLSIAPQDASLSSQNLVLHHLASFKANDLEAVLSDYTDQSVFITQTGTYSGVAEIRSFFVSLMEHFSSPSSSLTLDQLAVKDDLVLIVWHGQTPTLVVPFGSDTFIIREGKISQQTFAGEMTFLK